MKRGVYIIMVLLLATAVAAGTHYVNTLGTNQSIGNNNNLYLDNTNDFVGVETTAPSANLHVNGSRGISISPINLTEVGYIVDDNKGGSASSIEEPFGIYVEGGYAYVGSNIDASFSIFDIHDPTNIIEVSAITGGELSDNYRGIHVSGKYAYVISTARDALVIIDVSDHSNPTQTGFIKDDGSFGDANAMDGAYDVYVSGKYAYVASIWEDSLTIIDISDPYNPTEVSYLKDVDSGGPASGLNGARGVHVQGEYAYIVASDGDSLSIINVSDPYNPTEVTYLTDGVNATTLNWAYDVYVSGPYAYVAARSDGLSVINVSDPSDPVEVGTLTTAFSGGALDADSIVVSGDYAYITDQGGSGGVTMIDISDPASPFQAGYIMDETYGGNASELDGAANIFVSGKYGYVTARQDDSLSIIELPGLDSPTANIGDLATSSIDVWDNANVHNNLYVDNGVNVGPGGLYIGTGQGTATDGDLIVLGNLSIGTASPQADLHVKGDDGIEITPNNPVTVGWFNDTPTTDLGGPFDIQIKGKYAYVTSQDNDSFTILDVSNPTNIIPVGNYTSSTYLNGAEHIRVVGKYAYVNAYYNSRFSIFDISNPTKPTLAGSITDDNYGGNATKIDGTEQFYISGKYAYIIGSTDSGMSIIDISDPANMIEVGSINDTPASAFSTPIALMVQGDFAYITSYFEGLAIINISDPTNPTHVGSIFDDETTELNGGWNVYVSGPYAYVAGAIDNGVSIINISDPTNPIEIGHINNSDTGHLESPRDIYISGKYAYVTSLVSDTVSIIDISDPTNPVEAGFIQDDNQGGLGQELDGAYTLDIVGKYAYVTAHNDHGIEILELPGLDSPTANIGDIATSSINVWDNANIHNNLYIDGGLNIGPGGLYVDAGNGIATDSDFIVLGEIGLGTTTTYDYLLVNDSKGIEINPKNPIEIGYLTNADAEFNTPGGIYVSGKYAYVTSEDNNSMSIIDISDPANPVEVSYINDDFNGGPASYMSSPRAVHVAGKYAYVACNYDDGLTIIDISNPSNPVEVGNINNAEEPTMARLVDVYISGKYAYVVGSDSNGMTIIDISDPTDPVYTGHVNDSEFGGTATTLENPRNVYVQGDFAYVASYADQGLSIINISDPTNPTEVGQINSSTEGTATALDGAWDVHVSGKYAYVTSSWDNSTSIINISDPTNPTEVGVITDSEYGGGTASTLRGASRIQVSGKYAYVTAYYDSGISVIDISDPTDPVEVGHITDSFGGGEGTLLWRASGIFISGKYLYVTAANDHGFSIFEVAGLDSPTASIGSIATSSIDVWDNAQVANNLIVDNAVNVGPGGLYVDKGQGISTDGDVIVHGKMGINVKQPEADLHINSSKGIEIIPDGLTHIGSIGDGDGGAELTNAFSFETSGKYAYVGAYSGNALEIIDISDPTDPVHVSKLIDTSSGGNTLGLYNIIDVTVAGKYAYVLSNGNDTLSIFDISNPVTPVQVGYVQQGNGADALDQPRSIYVSGKYAYVTTDVNDSLTILDISDPTAPTEVSYILDGLGATYIEGTFDVYVQGSFAYITSMVDNALTIINISDPTNPTEAGYIRHGVGATALSYPFGVKVSGKYAYVTSFSSNSFTVINISDPTNPTEVSYLQHGTNLTYGGDAYSLDISGDYAYITGFNDASSAVTMIDISDPTNPKEVTYLQDLSTVDEPEFYKPTMIKVVGKYAYVTGYNDNGFAILEIPGLDSPTANIGDIVTSSLHVTDNANVHNNLYIGNALNVGPGGVYVDQGNGVTTDGDLVVLGKLGIGIAQPEADLCVKGNEGIKISPTEPTPVIAHHDSRLDGAQHIKIQGKYAYTVNTFNDGMAVVDISNPSHPEVTGNLSLPALFDSATGIAVAGKYAYICSYWNDSIGVIDISDPTNPSLVSYLIDNTYLNGVWNIYISGKYLYGADNYAGGLVIVDISDPTNLSIEGYTFNASSMTTAYDVYVQGDYAYLTSSGDDGLAIINISNPTSPVQVGNFTTNGWATNYLDQARPLYVSGPHAYIGSEGTDRLTILDVSDPYNPTFLGSVYDDLTLIEDPRDIISSGDYVYLASYSDGIAMVDVSDPTNPIVINENNRSYNASAANTGIDISGKYIYTSDIYDRIRVFEIGGLDSPTANIGDMATASLDVTDNAQITNDLYVGNGIVVGSGGVHSQGGYAGNAYGFAHLTTNSTPGISFQDFGESGSINTETSGVTWNGANSRFDIDQTGIYKATFVGPLNTSSTNPVTLALIADTGILNSVNPSIYTTTTLLPVVRGITWVGPLDEGQWIKLTMTPGGQTMAFVQGSTFSIRRIG